MSEDQISQNVRISGKGHKVEGFNQVTMAPASSQAALLEAKKSLIKILVLPTNPSSTTPLRLDLEIRAIDRALRESGLRDQFELEQAWAASALELPVSLLRHRPVVAHWCGHGSADGSLLFEDDPLLLSLGGAVGAGDAASRIRSTGALFAEGGGQLRCVVLNACHSEAQGQAIAEHIDCVIAMAGPIDDQAAVVFAGSFYASLGYGLSVEKAFKLATAQLGALGSASEVFPRLFAPRCDADSVVLVRRDP